MNDTDLNFVQQNDNRAFVHFLTKLANIYAL